MKYQRKAVRFPFMLLVAIAFLAIPACSESTTTPTESSTKGAVADARLVGRWKMTSKATLQNGHDVTAENVYEFKADGTFTNMSRSQLLNGDTGEPFYTQKTAESGTWTVDGDTTCWTTPNATLEEFESFTELITREMIEEGLSGDAPPECFAIVSADQATVVLRPAAGGDSVTLKRESSDPL